jgi:hypothetical protein
LSCRARSSGTSGAAAAFLTTIRAAEPAKGGVTAGNGEDGLIPLTVNEIRRLFATLILAARHTVEHVLAWSTFRQLCNQRARAAHYRKRLERLGSCDPP